MPTQYTRLGEYVMQGVAKALAIGTPIDVPNVGRCHVTAHIEPRMHQSNWSMQVDIQFPNSHSQMTVGLYTFGSCLLDDAENLALPAPTYEDENDKEFPPEHQAAWYKLLDAIQQTMESRGYVVGSSDEADFYFIEDYYPSRGISGSFLKSSLVSPEVAEIFQSVLREHSGWHFWIRIGLDFKDARYRGHDECVLVREDRVVLDMDVDRVRSELGNDFPWPGRSLRAL